MVSPSFGEASRGPGRYDGARMRTGSTMTVTAMVACLGCGDGAPRSVPGASRPGQPSGPVPAGAARPGDVVTPAAGARPGPPSPRSVLAAAVVQNQARPAPADRSKEHRLVDFADDDAARAERARDAVVDALLQAFPHPHAAGRSCDPNRPGTRPDERMGGVLLPTITQVAGAFTRAGASEIAFLIDYCPTGSGVPRTRRLLVLEAGVATFDHELLASEPFDEVLSASDLDGDGRAELLLTTSRFEDGRSMVDLSVVALRGAGPTTLGTWRAVVHCNPREPRRTTLALHVRLDGGAPVFRDEVTTSRCVYPPPPPAP